MRTSTIDVDLIDDNPLNLRAELTGIDSLAASLRATGLHVPIIVQVAEDGRYLLLAGHRRLRAAKVLKWPQITATVHEQALGEAEQIALMITENDAREGLSTLEIAAGYQHMLDLKMSVADVAKAVGVTQKAIKAHVALTKKASPEAIASLDHRQVSVDHLIALQEFEKHPDIHASAAKALGTAQFDSNLSFWRVQKNHAEHRAKTVAMLRKENPNVTVIPSPWAPGLPTAVDSMVWAERLGDFASTEAFQQRDEEPEAYEAALRQAHSDCPGHVVVVRGVAAPEVMCRQANLHSHESAQTDADIAEAAAEEEAAALRMAEIDKVIAEETTRRTAALADWVKAPDEDVLRDYLLDDVRRTLSAPQRNYRAQFITRITGAADVDALEKTTKSWSLAQLVALEKMSSVAYDEDDLTSWQFRRRWSRDKIGDLLRYGWKPSAAMQALIDEALPRKGKSDTAADNGGSDVE